MMKTAAFGSFSACSEQTVNCNKPISPFFYGSKNVCVCNKCTLHIESAIYFDTCQISVAARIYVLFLIRKTYILSLKRMKSENSICFFSSYDLSSSVC